MALQNGLSFYTVHDGRPPAEFMREVFDRQVTAREDRQFYGYFISFEPTGNEHVDAVLAAVASAGKACHHTEGWCEEAERIERVDDPDAPRGYRLSHHDEGWSWCDLIQFTANAAADRIAELSAEVARLRIAGDAILSAVADLDIETYVALLEQYGRNVGGAVVEVKS